MTYREATIGVHARVSCDISADAFGDNLCVQEKDGLEFAAVGTAPHQKAQIGRDEDVTHVWALAFVTLVREGDGAGEKREEGLKNTITTGLPEQ
jgi:hypothetical protein